MFGDGQLDGVDCLGDSAHHGEQPCLYVPSHQVCEFALQKLVCGSYRGCEVRHLVECLGLQLQGLSVVGLNFQHLVDDGDDVFILLSFVLACGDVHGGKQDGFGPVGGRVVESVKLQYLQRIGPPVLVVAYGGEELGVLRCRQAA